MYAAERQQTLLQRARSVGRVDVSFLATELAVTSETIRRDLTVLERRGLLRRVHGGAIPAERFDFEPEVAQRDSTNADEKDRIAKAALDEVAGQRTVLIDAGTTTARLAALLPVDRELTVVTNGLPVAAALVGRANLTVHLVGGRIRPTTQAAVDAWALQALDGLTVDVAFLGTNGFSVARGMTTPDPAEAAVKQAMVRTARTCVVLADASKHGVDQFARFATVEEVDVIISDTGLDLEDAHAIEAAGPRTVRA